MRSPEHIDAFAERIDAFPERIDPFGERINIWALRDEGPRNFLMCLAELAVATFSATVQLLWS